METELGWASCLTGAISGNAQGQQFFRAVPSPESLTVLVCELHRECSGYVLQHEALGNVVALTGLEVYDAASNVSGKWGSQCCTDPHACSTIPYWRSNDSSGQVVHSVCNTRLPSLMCLWFANTCQTIL